MMYMRGSLGVQCDHCHDEKDWSRDDKEAKRTARRMIRMVRALNKELDDDLAVSCYSCHRGRLRPATALPLLTERATVPSTIVKETPASKALQPEAVLKRYLEASGGAAWSHLTTRVVKGRLVTSEPAVYPAEIRYQSPNKFRSRILVDGAPFTKVFDGEHGWNIDNRGATDTHGVELERVRRQAAFALPVSLAQLYPALRVEGETTIAGEPAIVLVTTAPSGAQDRLFFSMRSGLLRRIESATESPLGVLPRRWDYEDYRKVDGVRLPFTMRETDPDYTYLWEFTSVKQNVALDEATFAR